VKLATGSYTLQMWMSGDMQCNENWKQKMSRVQYTLHTYYSCKKAIDNVRHWHSHWHKHVHFNNHLL